jgi:cob(I)alamin adenosyltransferase
MNVFIMQFMKGPWKAGERKALKKLSEYVEYEAMGDGFTWDTDNPEQDIKTAREAFDIAKEKLMSEKYQIIILDEINYVLEYKFFPLDEFIETLKNKPESVHVVCTGRNAHAKLIEIADLVTEMKLIKHPYDEQGIPAQKGIEF